MTIDSISLSNFRLYQKNAFKFSPSVTIVVGGNASGKTNLLEAIYLLATGKSFKADFEREMIAFGKEVGRVKGIIRECMNAEMRECMKEEEIELEIVLTTGEVMGEKTQIKKYSVNGVGKKILDFVGRLKAVLFWPEDLELVTDSPSLRRRYLDFVLMQADREYRRCLISYEKAIRQRNKLLEAIRDVGAHRHQLIFWDHLLIKNGEYITGKREEYIDYINKYQNSRPKADQPLAENVKCQNLKYQLIYDKSVISRLRLDQYSEEEIAAGVTLVGPHRDDMIFRIKTKDTSVEETRNLSQYGSRGEQRLGILWLKLGELAYIEKVTGEKPVLLLDDILSELDHEHRKIIFDVVGNQQTIITTTDEHFIDKSSLGSARDKLNLLKIIRL